MTIIGIIAALTMAVANNLTQGPIAAAKGRTKYEALQEIFPFKIASVKDSESNGVVFFEVSGTKGESASALELGTTQGYAGLIEVLIGFDADCNILDYKVVTHSETPGLGDKITQDDFRAQFRGKGLKNFDWRVNKDGGDVDAVTAATISSRAISGALERGLKLFAEKYPNKCAGSKKE